MKIANLICLTAAGLALSGCALGRVSKMTPAEQVSLIQAFAAAGCKGRVHAEAGGGVGQLGGEAHASASVDGDCDPANLVQTVN